ncbi:hypothetical protein [Candidatus Uabimicrobium sp. HlEnr_7]|uniref:hypothetical protein n=1 Tax=Candidatus Uabimicrobium helgolandensis TaxID=3095367 RepID=UPI0035562940
MITNYTLICILLGIVFLIATTWLCRLGFSKSKGWGFVAALPGLDLLFAIKESKKAFVPIIIRSAAVLIVIFAVIFPLVHAKYLEITWGNLYEIRSGFEAYYANNDFKYPNKLQDLYDQKIIATLMPFIAPQNRQKVFLSGNNSLKFQTDYKYLYHNCEEIEQLDNFETIVVYDLSFLSYFNKVVYITQSGDPQEVSEKEFLKLFKKQSQILKKYEIKHSFNKGIEN